MRVVGQLLKFNRPSDNALQNLEKGQLFCQHYAAYNDPFEFWTRISSGIPDPDQEPERYLAALRAWGFHYRTVAEAKSDKLIQESVDDYFDECQSYAPPFEQMRRQMRISCFRAEANNLLMWSHYGDGLRGFCIAFDEDAIKGDDGGSYVLDVTYLDRPPRVDSFIYGVAWDQDWYSDVAIEEAEHAARAQGRILRPDEVAMYEDSGAEALRTMREIWQHVLATKPAEWRYERERRLLVQTDMDDTRPLLRTYDRAAVKEVIVGERMPEDYRERLIAVMREHYPDAPVRTASRAEGVYSLSIKS